MELDRSMVVLADGVEVASIEHMYLSGKENLSLVPSCYTLKIWNLSDSDHLSLARCKSVSVEHESSVLAWGTLTDCYRKLTKEGIVSYVCFSPTLSFWETNVSLSLPAGNTVSETVEALLDASGSGVKLLSFPGRDELYLRSQAYYGRISECITEALSLTNARAYMVQAGLCVVPEEGLPITYTLANDEMIKNPEFASGRNLVVYAKAAGWSVGKAIEVIWDGGKKEGMIVSKAIDADNKSGAWKVEMLVEVAV